ncbi:MAG: hypothetical protein ACJAR4_002263 [Psychroserpens sp.]|jgi:hypothetical protein
MFVFIGFELIESKYLQISLKAEGYPMKALLEFPFLI